MESHPNDHHMDHDSLELLYVLLPSEISQRKLFLQLWICFASSICRCTFRWLSPITTVLIEQRKSEDSSHECILDLPSWSSGSLDSIGLLTCLHTCCRLTDYPGKLRLLDIPSSGSHNLVQKTVSRSGRLMALLLLHRGVNHRSFRGRESRRSNPYYHNDIQLLRGDHCFSVTSYLI